MRKEDETQQVPAAAPADGEAGAPWPAGAAARRHRVEGPSPARRRQNAQPGTTRPKAGDDRGRHSPPPAPWGHAGHPALAPPGPTLAPRPAGGNAWPKRAAGKVCSPGGAPPAARPHRPPSTVHRPPPTPARASGAAPPPGDAGPRPHLSPQPPPPPPSQEPWGGLRSPEAGSMESPEPALRPPRWRPGTGTRAPALRLVPRPPGAQPAPRVRRAPGRGACGLGRPPARAPRGSAGAGADGAGRSHSGPARRPRGRRGVRREAGEVAPGAARKTRLFGTGFHGRFRIRGLSAPRLERFPWGKGRGCSRRSG